MNRISSKDFSETPGLYLERVQSSGEPIVLYDDSGDSAVLISVEAAALLERIEDLSDLDAAREALREVDQVGSVPYEEARREIGLD